MSEPRTALQRAPLKKREAQGEASEEEPDRRSSFESLIPGEGRRHLFKRSKGRIGMG